MSRGKSISVKIATPKVIKALETRLDERGNHERNSYPQNDR